MDPAPSGDADNDSRTEMEPAEPQPERGTLPNAGAASCTGSPWLAGAAIMKRLSKDATGRV